MCCTIPSIQLVNHVDAGQWVKGFRTVRHAQQNTTGACEGFHSVLKLLQLSQRSRLGGRRLDWLLKVLTGEVSRKSDHCIVCHSAFANSVWLTILFAFLLLQMLWLCCTLTGMHTMAIS